MYIYTYIYVYIYTHIYISSLAIFFKIPSSYVAIIVCLPVSTLNIIGTCFVSRLRVFENKVLRRIFGPKRDEVTGEWRRLHNKELYAPYSSPNIIRVTKSRRLRWAGHVARMGERRGAYSGET
jgi:hypothetical protein